MDTSKSRRWNVMPTYRSVIIPEIRSEITRVDAYGNEERQSEVVGEFKIKIRPLGFRRLLTIYGHEISQYLWGNTGKYKITIERKKGNSKPFHFGFQQVAPSSKVILLGSNITTQKYEEIFKITFSKTVGEHRYFIEVYSQLEWPESKQEVMYLRVLDFDTIVVYMLAVLFSGGIGSLLTWWFMR